MTYEDEEIYFLFQIVYDLNGVARALQRSGRADVDTEVSLIG